MLTNESRFAKWPLTSAADPDPGSGAFLTPGSGMGKKSGSESGMSTRIIFPAIFWIKILKFFDADPEKNRIRDKHPGSTTLIITPED